ncbi:hypothetical protein F4818DRAFT_456099 [Hypoxylon cercidicola]|nr:hypothetical protein F4818DRAFT_456099 [Hypoxylon cercidicola]
MPPKRRTKQPAGAAKASSSRRPANNAVDQGSGSQRATQTSRKRRASGVGRGANRAKKQKRDADGSDNQENDDQEPGDNQQENAEKPGDDVRNGLDLSLRPISDITSAVVDLYHRIEMLLPNSNRLAHILLGTMCSGTEAPVEAMRMGQAIASWLDPDKENLTMDHVFSVEVVPFKQNYIRRNTEGCIIFNNVLDFINPKDGKAPTAMGAMKTIPGGIDILIAGTSCVEFSNLNTKRASSFAATIKDKGIAAMEELDTGDLDKIFEEIIANIDTMGESSQTFFAMLCYVRDYRPKVVLMENVVHAPWEQCRKFWFPSVGYHASVSTKIDTKDFYLPQTRNRGWLLALDRTVFGDKAEAIGKTWLEIIEKTLPRRASAPVESWLLSSTDQLTERARQDDSERALQPTSEHDWEHSKSRHARARKSERLPGGNPLTHWTPADTTPPYDRMDRLVLKTQGPRVQDCIDIWYLRGLCKGDLVKTDQGSGYHPYDMRFKNRILDLSQNVDRGANPPIGLSSCITPSGIPWVTNQSRLVTGFESLALQGLPLHRIQFGTETQDQMRELAGNAMSVTVCVATLEGIFSAISQHVGPLSLIFTTPRPEAKVNDRTSVTVTKMVPVEPFSTSLFCHIDARSMMSLVERCRRYCCCNGSAKYSTNDFLKCRVCHAIRCRWCHGNPPHYVAPFPRPSNTVSLHEVEQKVMGFLPTVITDLFTTEWNMNCDEANVRQTIAGYPELVECLETTVFYFKYVRITEAVTVCYSSNTAFSLRVKLNEKEIRYYLYLDWWFPMAKNFFETLGIAENRRSKQPVARSRIDATASSVVPQPESWELRVLRSMEIEADLHQEEGDITIAFRPKYPAQDHTQFDHLGLQTSIFQYYPNCDAPEFSLHATQQGDMFLFKDTQEIGPPSEDCYVIADECRQLESHECREAIIRFGPEIDIKKIPDGRTLLRAFSDGFWTPALQPRKVPKLRPYFKAVERLRLPASKNLTLGTDSEKQQILAEGVFLMHQSCDTWGILRAYRYETAKRGNWITVPKHDRGHIGHLTPHYDAKISSLEDMKVTAEILGADSQFGQLPPHQWILVGGKYVMHHMSEAMEEFEEDLKAQIPVFEARVKIENGLNIPFDTYRISMQYLVDYKALGYKAASFLPPTPGNHTSISVRSHVELNASLSQNMQISEQYERNAFLPFRQSLKPVNGRFEVLDEEALTSFKTQLAPLQRLSVGWILARERGNFEFVEQEIEEELVPQLKLRLVGSAKRRVHNRGGVVADDVGYGKTVVMIAVMNIRSAFDNGDSIQLRQEENPYRIHLGATLVVVPPHLVSQWSTETVKFSNIQKDEILAITKLTDLKDDVRWSLLARIRAAKLIIVSTAVLSDPKYHMNLAKFAGTLDPPFNDSDPTRSRKNGARGRPFEEWHDSASQRAGDNSARLLRLLHPQVNRLGDDRPDREEESANLFEIIESHRASLDEAQELSVGDFNKRKDIARRGTGKSGKTNYISGKKLQSSHKFTTKAELMKAAPYTHMLESYTFPRVIYDEFSYDDPAAAIFVRNSQAYSKWVLSATPPTRNLATICGIAKLINIHVARPIAPRRGLPRITEGPELQNKSNAEQLVASKFYSDQTIVERHQQGEKFLRSFASANPLDKSLAGGIQVVQSVFVARMTTFEQLMYNDLQNELKTYHFNADALPRRSRERLSPLFGRDGWEAGVDGRTIGTQALIFRASVKSEPTSDPSKAALLAERQDDLMKALQSLTLIFDKSIWLALRVLTNTVEEAVNNAINPAVDICVLLRDVWEKEYGRFGGRDITDLIYDRLKGPEECTLLPDSDNITFLRELNKSRSTTWVRYYVLDESNLFEIEEPEAKALVEDLERMEPEWDAQDMEGAFMSYHDSLKARFYAGSLHPDGKNANVISQEDSNEEEPDDGDFDDDSEEEEPAKRKNKERPLTKAQLTALLRSKGITFKNSARVSELRDLWDRHLAGELGEWEYAGQNSVRPTVYPMYKVGRAIRGGKYTLTRSEVSDASLALRKAMEAVGHAARQERVVRNSVSTEPQLPCDRCGRLVDADGLWLVSGCGHLLCGNHKDSKICGPPGTHRECPSLVKDAVVNLKTIRQPRGVEEEDEEEVVAAPETAPSSSKTKAIVAEVANIPGDEYVVLFSQFDRQIREIEAALKDWGIKVTTNPNPSSEKDKSGRGFKVRILKLGDATSAGTNLQYANHVMFASPLLANLQEIWDSGMKQATGRCVRHGQKKTVQVYHFVTANTVEVDMLELRRSQDIYVPDGGHVGYFRDIEEEESLFVRDDDDWDMDDADPNPNPNPENGSIASIMNRQEVWTAMNEQNWLTTVGIEY